MESLSLPTHGASRTRSAAISNWRLPRKQDRSLVVHRSRGQTFRVLINANVSSGTGAENNGVVMVHPLEAKQLAAEQMREIHAKEKFKRQRQIEAINGAWAMIGLTAGLVIEGQTGKPILNQLIGYWSTITGFFGR